MIEDSQAKSTSPLGPARATNVRGAGCGCVVFLCEPEAQAKVAALTEREGVQVRSGR